MKLGAQHLHPLHVLAFGSALALGCGDDEVTIDVGARTPASSTALYAVSTFISSSAGSAVKRMLSRRTPWSPLRGVRSIREIERNAAESPFELITERCAANTKSRQVSVKAGERAAARWHPQRGGRVQGACIPMHAPAFTLHTRLHSPHPPSPTPALTRQLLLSPWPKPCRAPPLGHWLPKSPAVVLARPLGRAHQGGKLRPRARSAAPPHPASP